MAVRHSAATRRRVLKLLRSGHSVMEVYQKTGVTRPTIYKWAEEEEIELVRKFVGRPGRIYDREAIRRDLKTKSVAEVCEKYGCSESYARMIRLGIY